MNKVIEYTKGYLINRGDDLGYWQEKPNNLENTLTTPEEIIIELCDIILKHETP